jgi:hypothetical protein
MFTPHNAGGDSQDVLRNQIAVTQTESMELQRLEARSQRVALVGSVDPQRDQRIVGCELPEVVRDVAAPARLRGPSES